MSADELIGYLNPLIRGILLDPLQEGQRWDLSTK
jgi:hypothetical protein